MKRATHLTVKKNKTLVTIQIKGLRLAGRKCAVPLINTIYNNCQAVNPSEPANRTLAVRDTLRRW